ncbi:YopX family protein [Paenibacillus nuruki]|uniref:YopX family protein n=1 Tax=Paenibacillus nuruki TaxID=1886670 RepID=UPI0028048791|nr:YopX family protein [Paenibacillus nuruki]CAJ1315941.1 hypothetical protein AASFL403_12015 [Paenibacillus nuruki]
MPREIKHRGFVPDQETWITGNLIGNNVIVGEIVDFNDEYFTTEFWQKVDPESVGQYTELEEMYEGDIVKYKSSCIGNPNENLVGVVSYLEAQFFIVNEKEERAIPLFTETAELEVIGNIYEHPELLES